MQVVGVNLKLRLLFCSSASCWCKSGAPESAVGVNLELRLSLPCSRPLWAQGCPGTEQTAEPTWPCSLRSSRESWDRSSGSPKPAGTEFHRSRNCRRAEGVGNGPSTTAEWGTFPNTPSNQSKAGKMHSKISAGMQSKGLEEKRDSESEIGRK